MFMKEKYKQKTVVKGGKGEEKEKMRNEEKEKDERFSRSGWKWSLSFKRGFLKVLRER